MEEREGGGEIFFLFFLPFFSLLGRNLWRPVVNALIFPFFFPWHEMGQWICTRQLSGGSPEENFHANVPSRGGTVNKQKAEK
jgi:hypothetical protein